jgi:hypothetical protein
VADLASLGVAVLVSVMAISSDVNMGLIAA